MRKQGCWAECVIIFPPQVSKNTSDKTTAEICIVNLGRFF